MNENWNWLLYDNSIIETMDPTNTALAPPFGGEYSFITKVMRGNRTDAEYISHFGLIDRTAEGSAASIASSPALNDKNYLFEDSIELTSIDLLSYVHVSLTRPVDFISYSLVNHIKNKFSFTTIQEIFSELHLAFLDNHIKLTVGNLGNRNYGFEHLNFGSLSTSYIGKHEITYLGSLNDFISISMDEIAGYNVYIKILDEEKVKLEHAGLIYAVKIEDIQEKLKQHMNDEIDVIISLEKI